MTHYVNKGNVWEEIERLRHLDAHRKHLMEISAKDTYGNVRKAVIQSEKKPPAQ